MSNTYPNQRFTTNLSLALFGMDEVLAENMEILDTAYGAGSSINVNGTLVTSPNLSSTLPAAPAGNTIVSFHFDINGNISGYVPSSVAPILPVTKAAIASNWLNSYNAATGLFTATQPNYTDIAGTVPTPPSGSVLWSAIGNAAAALTLSNANYATTFNQTSAVPWLWANTTAATAGTLSPSSFAVEPTTATRNNFTGALGMLFTVNTNITVSQLGRLYVAGNTQNHVIKLWVSTNTVTPIASGTILAASASDANGFKWVSVTPVVLSPGNTYAIVIDETASGDTWKDTWTPTMQPEFTNNGQVYTATPGAYPNNITLNGSVYNTAAMAYTAAISTPSPVLTLAGTYWTGAASAVDAWSIQDFLATGTNAPSTLVLAHTGSSGAAAVQVPQLDIAGSDNGISRLGIASLAIGNGAAGDMSGTLSLGKVIAGAGATSPVTIQTTDASGTYGALYFVATPTPNNYTLASNGSGTFLYSASSFSVTIGAVSAANFNNSSLEFGSAILLGWSSTAAAGGAADTGISRLGAASLAIGNGTAGDITGTLTALNYTSQNTFYGKTFQIVGNNSNNVVLMGSAVNLDWSSTTSSAGSIDTNIGRLAAGSLAIGNGTAGDYSGSIRSSVIINPQAVNYIAAAVDASQLVNFTDASAVTFTIPTNASVAFPVGTVLTCTQSGAGQITLTPASGAVTIHTPSSLTSRAQFSTIGVVQTAANVWTAMGDLT